MPQYQEDLQLVLELLAAGVDPEQGLNMFLQAQANQDERRQSRRQARAEALSAQQEDFQEGLESLIEKTTTAATEEGATPEAVTAQFNALAGAYGFSPRQTRQAFKAVKPLVGTISSWDADDATAVDELVKEAKRVLGTGKDINRADVREYAKNKIISRIGPENFAAIAPDFHRTIDTSYFTYFSGPQKLDYEAYQATQEMNQAEALQKRLAQAQRQGKGFARFNQQRYPVSKLPALSEQITNQNFLTGQTVPTTPVPSGPDQSPTTMQELVESFPASESEDQGMFERLPEYAQNIFPFQEEEEELPSLDYLPRFGARSVGRYAGGML